jgi:hypothetical protein
VSRAYIYMLVAMLLLVCGCSGKQAPTASKQESRVPLLPLPLSQVPDGENEVFPLANGNAYLVSTVQGQAVFE